MAYLEIKHALLPAESSVPQEFIWITFDADPNVEDAALEWNADTGFCFRLRADVARQLAAKLTQTLSDT